MALELLAAIVAAVALGGMAHLVRRLSGGWLPRWIVPVAAALGLIGVTIVIEYAWFGAASAELPPGVEVVWTETGGGALRPWTLAVPMTTRFIAMDLREIAQHPANADLRLVRVYDIARGARTRDAMMVFDCAAGRQILLTDQAVIDDQGVLTGADWVVAAEGDGVQTQACGKE